MENIALCCCFRGFCDIASAKEDQTGNHTGHDFCDFTFHVFLPKNDFRYFTSENDTARMDKQTTKGFSEGSIN
jgi:hypothetical protein